MTLLATILVSFLALLAVIGAMSVGIIAGRKPIRGSCGGSNGGGCELCNGQCSKESQE